MLNPRMKAAEFSMTLRRSWLSLDFSSSTPAPEIRDTYPGTKGRTQGERKEMMPAIKAARGSGKVDIEIILPVYLSFRENTLTGATHSGPQDSPRIPNGCAKGAGCYKPMGCPQFFYKPENRRPGLSHHLTAGWHGSNQAPPRPDQ